VTARTRHDQIADRSRKFAAKYPEVGRLFDQFAIELLARGFKHYSAAAVWHRIRWESPAGSDGRTAWKLNNDFCSLYARKFMQTHPEYKGFFRTRKLKSKDAPASTLPALGPDDYKADA
jgi:hypothetical protein